MVDSDQVSPLFANVLKEPLVAMIRKQSHGLFGRALAPLKMALTLAHLKEQLLWRS